MIHFAMLVAGLLLAGWNTWQRLGRSHSARAWTRGLRSAVVERNVLVGWPLLAAALVLGGALGVVEGTVSTVVALLLLATLLVWLAYTILPLPIPGFVVPRWHERAVPDGSRG